MAYGFEPVIFERLDKIGGLWRYNSRQFESDLASVMKFTVIDSNVSSFKFNVIIIYTASKEMNAYSDFPPPDHFANYMHNVFFINTSISVG